MKDPIRPGSDTSVKSCAVVYVNPTLRSFVAAMLQTSQTENPRFSARIDQMRLRRAIDLPLFSQNSASSGFQSLIHLDMSSPGLETGESAGVRLEQCACHGGLAGRARVAAPRIA